MKVNVKRFSFNNLLQDFKIMKNFVYTAMDAYWNNRRKESTYIHFVFSYYFNQHPLSFVVLVCVILPGEFFLCDYGAHPTSKSIRDGFYAVCWNYSRKERVYQERQLYTVSFLLLFQDWLLFKQPFSWF